MSPSATRRANAAAASDPPHSLATMKYVSQVQVQCPNEGDNETLIRKVRRDVVGMSFSKVQRNDHIFL